MSVHLGQRQIVVAESLKILELREKSKEALGQAFDIKKFHDKLLENGALPLSLLEDVMNA